MSSTDVKFTMISDQIALPDILVHLTLLKNDIVNILWTPAIGDDPFMVPDDIVNVNRSDVSDSKVLSDFVSVSSDYNIPSIVIKNSNNQTIYSLNGFILD